MIDVAPGHGTLQAALAAAPAGAELLLADGNYTGSDANVVEIGKNITIRAQNAEQAALDGETSRRVIQITGGTVVLDGLAITRGHSESVSAHFLNLSPTSSTAPLKCHIWKLTVRSLVWQGRVRCWL